MANWEVVVERIERAKIIINRNDAPPNPWEKMGVYDETFRMVDRGRVFMESDDPAILSTSYRIAECKKKKRSTVRQKCEGLRRRYDMGLFSIREGVDSLAELYWHLMQVRALCPLPECKEMPQYQQIWHHHHWASKVMSDARLPAPTEWNLDCTKQRIRREIQRELEAGIPATEIDADIWQWAKTGKELGEA